MKLLYGLLQNQILIQRKNELETLFQQIKNSVTKNVILTLLYTKDLFSIFQLCFIGTSCVQFQLNKAAYFILYISKYYF